MDYGFMDNKQYIFGVMMVLTNKIDTLLDRELNDYHVTAKQFQLSMVVNYMFEDDPTVSQIAKVMGTTHQNVKQIANKLHEKKLVELYTDPHDRRAVRIKMTKYGENFWSGMQSRADQFVNGMFSTVGMDSLITMRNTLNIIQKNLLRMETGKEE